MNKKKIYINDERKTKGLSALSQAIQPFAKQLLGQKGFVEIDILTNWTNIVGEDLSAYSMPQKIDFKKGEKNNGVLNLLVPSGAFALEIQHREKIIIDKVNQYFGYNAVSKLKIIQNYDLSDTLPQETATKKHKSLVTPEEEKYINEVSDEVTDPKLKEILIKLGKSIIDNNKK